MVAAKKGRLRNQAEAGHKSAQVALNLAEKPERFLSTVQIGITLVGVLAGAFAGATVSEALAAWMTDRGLFRGQEETVAVALVVAVITFLSLVLGELVPKQLALRAPERVATLVARPMRLLSLVSSPAVWLLSVSSTAILRLLRLQGGEEQRVTEEDVRILLKESEEAGVLEPIEGEILGRMVRLDHIRVTRLMTPRPDLVWLDSTLTPAENNARIADAPHSFFPVMRGSQSHIVGIVAVRDLHISGYGTTSADLESPCAEPLYIPETISALRVLETFKQSKAGIALVLDEFGSVEGLVTLNDLLEAIVGDLPSVTDPADWFMQREDGTWLADGLLPLDELAERLGAELGAFVVPGVSTLGGMIGVALEAQAKVGDSVVRSGHRFEVVDLDGQRIDKVLIESISELGES